VTLAAIIISCASLVVASLALFVSFLGYRRGGARIQVRLAYIGTREGQWLELIVVNTGTSAIEVSDPHLALVGSPFRFPFQPEGVHLLGGMSSLPWRQPTSAISSWLERSGNPPFMLKPGIRLPEGKVIYGGAEEMTL
jgi:hypothetical protein